jgi:hypothetical protein
MNLAALFFDLARRLPHQPAVSDDRHAWSYDELAERVERVAGGLRAHGLAPGDRVLLSLDNCGEFFELLLGCWAAGLCAVPANARLHRARLNTLQRIPARGCCWRRLPSSKLLLPWPPGGQCSSVAPRQSILLFYYRDTAGTIRLSSDLVARGHFAWAQKHGDRPARHRVVDMDWQEAALLDDTVDGSW